ncbi:unnamed protein product [Rodentolepis nana]|uniref:DDHD domain-containing protein n=1 Tax=Rodentolepis nana TaxID=102285 RepID=A0A0R3TKK3_RODNA|nr:unnamed protein product [Rodentolepis nana]
MPAHEIIESNNTFFEAEEQFQLSPSKVRWFYKDEIAKKWVAFNGYDSIKIELTYLRLLKCKNGFSSETDDNFKPLVVRDGLYEVDVVTKQCYPIYWESHTGPTSILRGIWFKDPGLHHSVPIEDESMVEQLETTYAMLQCRLSTTESGRSGSSSPKLGTDEESGTETTSAIVSIFSSPAKSSFGTRLGRGYFEEADPNTPPPVYSHLCFVVHGIGQKFQKGSIITLCDRFIV